MEEKIRINEYVRTECGIAKIKEISIKNEVYELDKDIMYIHQENYLHTCTKSQILKHSFNIKELIEEGDIVNESLIVYKGKVASGKEKLLVGNHIINGMSLEVASIKSILTHEQYKRDCYVVKEEIQMFNLRKE